MRQQTPRYSPCCRCNPPARPYEFCDACRRVAPRPGPIETRFNGYRFRSRVEARWAVFFDALGVRFEYEREGFTLCDGTRYLPDFWLSTVNMWAEVKAERFTGQERDRCRELCRLTGYEVIELAGPPEPIVYGGWMAWDTPDGRDVEETDWYLDDLYLDEHRFFQSCGLAVGDSVRWEHWLTDRALNAYERARGARFEFGETGWSR